MSIHGSHPFLPPPGDRNRVRQFRGRLPAPVTVWTAVSADGVRFGWTVSSVLVADGESPEVLGLLDPDADLFGALVAAGRFAVSVLTWEHRQLAEVFAEQAPAPGGLFAQGEFEDTEWGPIVVGAAGWLGATLLAPPEPAGWSALIRGRIDHLVLGDGDALAALRGRYVPPAR